MTDLTLGQRIAAKRNELSLSQSALGEQLGVSRQSVFKWESDAAVPEIDKLIGLRSRIIEDLRSALESKNLGVFVDRNTGAIAFEGAVLFDVNRNELKDGGKELLNAFIPVYIRTLMSEENEGYVGEIIIEGHTDTSGSYLHNLALSQERALAVASYCLGSEMMGLTEEEKLVLQEILTANGRSESDPVYAADGSVDMEASRRVVFKFRMKDSDMIDQMSEILEGQQVD